MKRAVLLRAHLQAPSKQTKRALLVSSNRAPHQRTLGQRIAAGDLKAGKPIFVRGNLNTMGQLLVRRFGKGKYSINKYRGGYRVTLKT